MDLSSIQRDTAVCFCNEIHFVTLSFFCTCEDKHARVQKVLQIAGSVTSNLGARGGVTLVTLVTLFFSFSSIFSPALLSSLSLFFFLKIVLQVLQVLQQY